MADRIGAKEGDPVALQDNLRAARNRMGMSQELVAERLGVSRQAVTKWELGQSKPSAKHLQILAELYQVSAEELLADAKGPNISVRCMEKQSRRSGMGFISVLTLIFIVLKMTKLISWSWLWVLSPIWLTALFLIIVFSAIMVGGRIAKGKW